MPSAIHPVRHHGDPAAEYAAATLEGAPGAALFDRSHRVRIRVEGRAPAQMLHGLVSGRIPASPFPPGSDPGRSEPGALPLVDTAPNLVLTPKGRIVTDLRLVRLAPGDDAPFLMELPLAGRDPLLGHLARYLPPRFARPVEVTEETRMLTLVGPKAADLLSDLQRLVDDLAGDRVDAPATWPAGDSVLVLASDTVSPPAFDLLGTPAALAPVEAALLEAGVRPAGSSVWETLRIERGTPETGPELDEGVIPPEAGLERSHIDATKGCYTGQEVIVRIRDRGHVNRHLRGLLLGDLPTPPAGTELWVEGRDRAAGQILSVAQSPRYGQGVALAWVRREAEPGSRVRLGGPEGDEADVRALGPDGWGDAMASDDPSVYG